MWLGEMFYKCNNSSLEVNLDIILTKFEPFLAVRSGVDKIPSHHIPSLHTDIFFFFKQVMCAFSDIICFFHYLPVYSGIVGLYISDEN